MELMWEPRRERVQVGGDRTRAPGFPRSGLPWDVVRVRDRLRGSFLTALGLGTESS